MVDIDGVIFYRGNPVCIIESKEVSPEVYERNRPGSITKSQQKFMFNVFSSLNIPAYLLTINDPSSWVPYDIYMEDSTIIRGELIDPDLRTHKLVGPYVNDLAFVDEFNREEFIKFLRSHLYERVIV